MSASDCDVAFAVAARALRTTAASSAGSARECDVVCAVVVRALRTTAAGATPLVTTPPSRAKRAGSAVTPSGKKVKTRGGGGAAL